MGYFVSLFGMFLAVKESCAKVVLFFITFTIVLIFLRC